MWRLRQVLDFIGFFLTASTPRQIHSPYLFDLLQFVHDPSRRYYAYDQIESLRSQLLQSEVEIDQVDYGAGSRVKGSQHVTDIVKTSLSSAVKCQTVFRLLAHEKPQTILELGTSFGIMTAYLASAREEARVHTIEGNPSLSSIARNIAQQLGIQNIQFHVGRFDDQLPLLLQTLDNINFLLIDGDHRGEALKAYFSSLKPFLSSNAIVMIDDIRWSPDMKTAWKEISHDEAVTCSLDYFSFGLLFFRRDFLDKVRLKIRPQGLREMLRLIR